MKIKWRFDSNLSMPEGIGSTEEFMNKIITELGYLSEEKDVHDYITAIEHIVMKCIPKSPGDVLLIGTIMGSWQAFNAMTNPERDLPKSLRDLLRKDRNDAYLDYSQFFATPPEDCYNKKNFLKDMYNIRNDF